MYDGSDDSSHSHGTTLALVLGDERGVVEIAAGDAAHCRVESGDRR